MFVNNLGTPTQSVAFEASDEVLTGRLLARGNFDDTEESIKKRLAYYDKTPGRLSKTSIQKSLMLRGRLMRFLLKSRR